MTTDRGVIMTNTAWSVINDGELDFNRDFRILGDSTALMGSVGKVFRARSLRVHDTAVFTLADGTLYLDGTAAHWGLDAADSGYLDITSPSAVFKRIGDYVTVIDGQITSGFIRGNGSIVSPSAFFVTFDGTDTVVTLVPAGTPASVSIDATNTVYAGEAFTLTPDVSGSSPITHQWYKGASLLSGETNATYSSTNALLADAGEWSITVSNAFGTASATTDVVVVELADVVYWDNESGDGLANTVNNWNPNILPSLSLAVSGIVTNLGGATVVKTDTAGALNDVDITFEDGTEFDHSANVSMVAGRLVFNGSSELNANSHNFEIKDGSSLVLSNTVLNTAKLFGVKGSGNVMTVADNASLDIKRSWRLETSSGNNTLNWFSTGTMRTGLETGHPGNDGILLNRSSGNVLNISAGKVSGDENGITVTSGNYINFTENSTGILEARGVDFSDTFTDYVTNGLIRTEEIVATNLSVFVINYDGTDTTMTWTGEIIVIVNDIQFSDIGYVAASNGMVLAWTTDPADAGLDVYRTMNLVIPSWSLIATDVVNSYTDTAITNQAFYQLVPTGVTYP